MRLRSLLSFLITGNPFSDRELADVRKEISFVEAISAHLAWKTKLVEALAGKAQAAPDAAEIGKDTACALGQWIHGSGQARYGDLPAFDGLRQQHARFHRLAGEVVELTRANKNAEASRLMANEFQQTSHDIVTRLSRMSKLFNS